MTIADRIQSLRKTKGISQEELADKIGVSRQAVSKWESEQNSPEFILINVWFITLMPVTCIFNFIQATLGGFWWTFSPFPSLRMGYSLISLGLCWLCYIAICILTDIVVLIKDKKR